MKKRNVKSLKLTKHSVSNLNNENVKGGANSYFNCPTIHKPCTSFIDACPSAWVCPPTEDPRLCPYPPVK